MSFSSLEVAQAMDELRGVRSAGGSVDQLVAARFELGLAWPTFDQGRGGLGASDADAREAERVMGDEGIPKSPGGFVGVVQVARLLHDWAGSDVQDRFLRATFTGAVQWCQLFSEPGAGSDLANISTRAELMTDGSWRLTGQKTWTSNARHAGFALLLARTDPGARKHAGLTMFVVDMQQSGVTVRPLRQMDGGERFSEVYLDGAVALDELRIGELGEGWAMSMRVLSVERDGASALFARPLGELLDIWRDRRRALAPALRDRVVKLWIRDRLDAASGLRHLAGGSSEATNRLGAIAKIVASERAQEQAELLALLLGTDAVSGVDYAAAAEEDADPRRAASTDFAAMSAQRFIMRARAMSVEGGTNQIARNIVGERVLDLPPEPRVDKMRPWNELERA